MSQVAWGINIILSHNTLGINTRMKLNEVFSNYRPEHTDNATCPQCDATFTIPTAAIPNDDKIACPRCGKGHKPSDVLDRKRDTK